uniref:Reverse transcriptase domain-containing protein n=1 Tax=Ascaris lumbricoides TaxID=6252 RepID=A0A0M3HEZ3_ASCLU
MGGRNAPTKRSYVDCVARMRNMCKTFGITQRHVNALKLLPMTTGGPFLMIRENRSYFKGRSTLTQFMTSYCDWCEALNNGFRSDVVYIDFARAFDMVTHPKLLVKLKEYGTDRAILAWLKDLLCGGSFRVKVGNASSSLPSVLSRVPQGSVLGSVLFLVYVNDFSIYVYVSRSLEVFPRHSVREHFLLHKVCTALEASSSSN